MHTNIKDRAASAGGHRGGIVSSPKNSVSLGGNVAIFNFSSSPSGFLNNLRASSIQLGLYCAIVEKPEQLDARPDLIILNWDYYQANKEHVRNLFRSPFSGEVQKIPTLLLHQGNSLDLSQLAASFAEGIRDVLVAPFHPVEVALRIQNILHLGTNFNQEINDKTAAIKSLHLIIQSMSARMESLLSVLKRVRRRPGIADVFPEINRIIREINHGIPSDRTWKTHHSRTTLYDEGLIKELTARHPNLTSGELKYCCLAKLNISRKEAAEVLDVSPAAIEKRRYRINKKIGVFGRLSLEKYLRNI